jgi:molecular chaperone GrpE
LGLTPENLEDCQAALAETQREAYELKDRYLRAAAQVENVRKWTEREILSRARESQRSLLRQLLEVMDNLERALAQPAEPAVLYQGVELTSRQLEKVLAQAGVERIQVEPGLPFDPVYQEAVEVRRGDVSQPTVVAIVQPGYLHEKELLRPARVVVVA